MVCLGLKPEAARWKAQMNTLSYGGPLILEKVNNLKRSVAQHCCGMQTHCSFPAFYCIFLILTHFVKFVEVNFVIK